LKKALGFASQAQDNQMRALVLALISAHYVHTSGTQAREILKTCEQLAAGLGVAKGKKKSDSDEKKGGENGIGNAPLRLWIGERFVGE
jgi:ribosomal protein L17